MRPAPSRFGQQSIMLRQNRGRILTQVRFTGCHCLPLINKSCFCYLPIGTIMQGGKKENHPHLDPLPLACWSHTASRSRERNVKGRRDCSGAPSLAMTNRDAVAGFSLVPELGLHDLERSHYRRVWSLGGEIATLPPAKA